jgi:hypothetical protein
MTKHPLAAPDRPLDVAVVIPAYNAGRYLDQTLASVAGQTRTPAVVVVADDGSTDDTPERARRWQDHLPIEVVRLAQNVGPGPARHHAILATNASLLALVDADDLWLPDHLETMVAAYQRAPGLVTAREFAWIRGRGIDLARRRAKPRIPIDPKDQLVTLLQHNYVSFGFFPRALYERVGGFRSFLVGEDWDLWIRMVRTGARLTEASHPTALHRVRPGSLSVDPAHNVERGGGRGGGTRGAGGRPAGAANAVGKEALLRRVRPCQRRPSLAGASDGGAGAARRRPKAHPRPGRDGGGTPHRRPARAGDQALPRLQRGVRWARSRRRSARSAGSRSQHAEA